MCDIHSLNEKFVEYGILDQKVRSSLLLTLNDHLPRFKPRCLLVSGPSGSGKTYLANILKHATAKTMVTIDAKDLSEVGYSGKDPISIFEKLLSATSGNIEEAENGIIHLDEFDKLASVSQFEKDVNGVGVQQSLLKPLDGFDIILQSLQKSRMNPSGSIILNTNNIIFIFTGSFKNQEIYSYSELISVGFLPELAYRIDFYLHLKQPSTMDLASKIDTDRVLEDAAEFAKKYGLEISFPKNFNYSLAKASSELDGNYRTLHFILKNTIYRKIVEMVVARHAYYNFKESDLELLH
ncbi:ATP-dependent protease ATP-binding subunit ClpX [Bartonella australis AUST/NH1]|uniref:ATP-dependent protease ATP-binding subunit ClpX n=1 Tax=Bartonella australis (strain Aust/NH1) TaxID=1094489 RepID=M1NXF7_BARAA|nr:AAA family ATPase [Bartonella australis]AGF74157.1 ATP-dependent protease ATP-binding subunit ClpX [Bartonella australis AUST/NH1]